MLRIFAAISVIMLSALSAVGQSMPRVAKVQNGGLLFTDNQAGISGTDAGYTLNIGDKTLWLFGDIFLLDPDSTSRSYVGALSNGALLVDRGSGANPLKRYKVLTDPKTGIARPVIASHPSDTSASRLWPFGGWFSSSTSRAYLFYSHVRVTGKGPLDFKSDGFGLAFSDTRKPDEIRFERIPADENNLLWWPSNPGANVFGSAAFEGRNDGWLYVIGYREAGGAHRARLARVRPQSIQSLKSYEYFAGHGPDAVWTRDSQAADEVDGLNDFPTELSVSYNGFLGGYLAVHQVNLSERIRLSLAVNPWGPYRQIAEIPAPKLAFTTVMCYAGKEHPELREQDGKVIYITYVDGGRYWLRLLKVTLEK